MAHDLEIARATILPPTSTGYYASLVLVQNIDDDLYLLIGMELF